MSGYSIDGADDLDDLLLNFRQLRTMTALHMETYAIHNRLIQLVEVVSSQVLASIFAFLGIMLALANTILVVQQVTTEVIVMSFFFSGGLLIGVFWLYQSQLREKIENRRHLLQEEKKRLDDGINEYTVVRMTVEGTLIPSINRLLSEKKIGQARADSLKQNLLDVIQWLDNKKLPELRKELEADKQELKRLNRNE